MERHVTIVRIYMDWQLTWLVDGPGRRKIRKMKDEKVWERGTYVDGLCEWDQSAQMPHPRVSTMEEALNNSRENDSPVNVRCYQPPQYQHNGHVNGVAT